MTLAAQRFTVDVRVRFARMLQREPEDEPRPAASGFSGVEGRGSVNYLLRNTQQELVALSSQADFKASILITACSVVLTIGAAQVQDASTELRWGYGVLAVCLFVSMFGAVLCVLPSSISSGTSPVPSKQRNPLFFGHFIHWDEDEYVDHLGDVSRDDATVYEAQARDLHQQGSYLVRHKYRFLRLGYTMFLTGFVAGALAIAIAFVAS